MTQRDGVVTACAARVTSRDRRRGMLASSPAATPMRALVLAFALASTAAAAQSLVHPSAARSTDALASRSAALLAGWSAGDFAPTLAALAPAVATVGARDLPRVARALERGRGAVTGVDAEGVTLRADGFAEAVVFVRFARGTERLSVVWTPAGQLWTVTRARPLTAGTVAFEARGCDGDEQEPRMADLRRQPVAR